MNLIPLKQQVEEKRIELLGKLRYLARVTNDALEKIDKNDPRTIMPSVGIVQSVGLEVDRLCTEISTLQFAMTHLSGDAE